MANTTLKALSSLSEQVPGLNQRALKQVQAARDIGLQRQIQQAPAVPQAAAGLATQQALQAGQDVIAQRQAAAGRAAQIRQATLQERQRVGQQRLQQQQMQQQAELQRQEQEQLKELRKQELASRKSILQDEIEATDRLQQLGIEQDNKLQIATLQQREDLASLGLDLKAKLLDARMQFTKDERGRKFTNERQLADYAAASAKSKVDFNRKMAQIKNAHDQKVLIMKQAEAQMGAALERGYLKEQGDLDFQSQQRLAILRRETNERIKREEARAKNRQAMWQAGGTILGAGAGAAIGGPAGAGIGASIGQATGSILQGAMG